jgi:hypothetical protein
MINTKVCDPANSTPGAVEKSGVGTIDLIGRAQPKVLANLGK